VLAVDSSYSSFVFTSEPTSEREYFRLLSSLDSLETLSEAERQRAAAMYFIQYELFSSESFLVPNPPAEAHDEAAFWRAAAELLKKHDVHDDPFYAATKRFLASNDRHLLNRDLTDELGLDFGE
jgi:hypothetical protein